MNKLLSIQLAHILLLKNIIQISFYIYFLPNYYTIFEQ